MICIYFRLVSLSSFFFSLSSLPSQSSSSMVSASRVSGQPSPSLFSDFLLLSLPFPSRTLLVTGPTSAFALAQVVPLNTLILDVVVWSFHLVHITSCSSTLCFTARTSQRACVGSSVHNTGSSLVHHLHGSGATDLTSRTLPHQQKHAAIGATLPTTRNDGCADSTSTPARAVGWRSAATTRSTAATATTAAEVLHGEESQD